MLPNNAGFNKSDLLTLFSSDSFINFPDNFNCSGISTDTRTLKAGEIFIALPGESSDGHTRIDEAFGRGASAAIVNHDWNKKNIEGNNSFIVVQNTLETLGKLANYHRKRFKIPVIAIGGSNGKTTTKNIAAHLLSQKFRLLSTHENFNNQIGVPLMLLQMTNWYEVTLLEMGTNEPGEISILSSIMEPTHGLLTNIGREHLEKLIDLDGVEFEETTLFGYLAKRNSTAFINFDDDRLMKYIRLFENVITYGTSEESDVKAKIELDDELHPILNFSFADRKFTAKLNTIGFTTGLNAIAATSIAIAFGLSDDEIKYGLETYYQPQGHGYGRMYLEHFGPIKIINDCYNANPDSMAAALQTLRNFNTKAKKFAVLGDMRELGDASYKEHCSLLSNAASTADIIMITGIEMKKAFDEIKSKNIEYFTSKEELSSELKNRIKDGDVILVKGSRGMTMEMIIEDLKNNLGT
ncbi:MAG: UDP-N-acetylmuramoyl-tripeptide--D-alanyl-D-alanine ligase [Ignavibacteriae bacterium]|nr:UDP-N-acetylmuramoyl-tripeptide--D-alanyl-D-alanine ligase [Ignavibacteriota bacterium]